MKLPQCQATEAKCAFFEQVHRPEANARGYFAVAIGLIDKPKAETNQERAASPP